MTETKTDHNLCGRPAEWLAKYSDLLPIRAVCSECFEVAKKLERGAIGYTYDVVGVCMSGETCDRIRLK